MRRFLTIVVLVLVILAGFYVAWPAWTGRQIRQAIEANDPAALSRKIDFDRVRARAKPVIAEQVQRSLDEFQKQAGPFGAAIAGQLKGGLGERLANAAIDTSLTPENVIRLARQGKTIGRILKDIAREGAEQGPAPGGSVPPASPPPAQTGGTEPPPEGPPRRRLTRENIKAFRITGPLSLEVGIAHDPKASTPDVIAELAFTGGDWKVVGILPQL